jgi:hypothetical protein
MLADKIVTEVQREPGVTDRRLSEIIFGSSNRRTQINGECHYMQSQKIIERRIREDGLIGNYPVRPKPNLQII